MRPIGSLENLLHAIAEQAARGLLGNGRHGGAGHAGRNAAQPTAAVDAERREDERDGVRLAGEP